MNSEKRQIIKKLKLNCDIDNFEDSVDWYDVSRLKLSIEFMDMYFNHLNWFCICSCQVLPEWFIEKYKTKVDWLQISYNQRLSEKFIIKHLNRLHKHIIIRHQPLLSMGFINKYIDEIHF